MRTIQTQFRFLTENDIAFELSEAAFSIMKFMNVNYHDALYYCQRVVLENDPKNVIDEQIVKIFRERNNNKQVLFRVLGPGSPMFENTMATA